MRLPSGKNPNPVAIRPGVAVASSDEVRQHFLCLECERRLNDGGERWVIANCYQADGKFPLYDNIITRPPLPVSPIVTLYESRGVPGIEPEQLGFFAASILWRAGATDWRNKRSPRIELGPYEDSLRQYLLGRTPFPKDAALRVILPTPALARLIATLPMPDRVDGVRSYKVFIPGIAFTMILGKHIPNSISEVAFMPSPNRIICISDQIHRNWLEGVTAVIGAAEPKGYLKTLRGPGQGRRG
jgi:hypothetical protein